MCRTIAKICGIFVLLVSVPAAAVELGKLSIDGFGSWAYGASNNANNFSVAQHTGQFSSGDFALALTARLSDRAVTGGQVRVLPREQMVYIDWLLGEWRFSDQARLRFGIVKHPFGIFAGSFSRCLPRSSAPSRTRLRWKMSPSWPPRTR
jgi:hypothetical protein